VNAPPITGSPLGVVAIDHTALSTPLPNAHHAPFQRAMRLAVTRPIVVKLPLTSVSRDESPAPARRRRQGAEDGAVARFVPRFITRDEESPAVLDLRFDRGNATAMFERTPKC
jgi:hypothetical protein